ncbi:regulatory protein RecX [Bacteriovoracaceae bacterium]|nr:regulatory protein RecX [Bacteriovoracaceae bacterium]
MEINETNKKCYLYAIRLLARRDYSRHKLTQKLIDKKFEKEIATDVIQYLIDESYLKEEHYIEARIKGFMHKNYSAHFVMQKLNQENCYPEEEIIEQIFREYNVNSETQILDLIRKKLNIMSIDKTNIQKSREKLIRYVLSKGHQYSEANRYISNAIDAHL